MNKEIIIESLNQTICIMGVEYSLIDILSSLNKRIEIATIFNSSPSDVARILGVSYRTVYRWSKEGLQNKLIKFSKQNKVKNLIPVHINKCRCDDYYWDWSSEHNDWIRGKKIPELLKRMYKNPVVK